MRKREFTPEERKSLESNPNVLKIVNTNIVYTEEFKQHAIDKHKEGVAANSIFIKADIDISIFPKNYARYAIKRWKSQITSIKTKNKSSSGRPKMTSNMTQDELEARIAYLEAENDFLKKLKALERGG